MNEWIVAEVNRRTTLKGRSTQCKTRFSNSAKLEGGRVELRSEQVARGVATEISVNQIRIV